MKTVPFLFLLTSLFLGGCAQISLDDVAKTPSWTIKYPQTTSLGQLFAPYTEDHAGQSGFILLDRGEESLVWRGVLADVAERTIDAQYFIWKEDNVGTIAAEYLLRAAGRGVRVRVLIDDLPIDTEPRYLVLLDAHPNIEIRIYNPITTTPGSVIGKIFSAFHDFKRFNQRMHNKAYIVDGTVSITGGRNIADEYFDMHSSYNFRDRDVLAAGPIVKDIAGGFDAYWNSKWAVPVNELVSLDTSEEERAKYYAALHAYAREPSNHPARFQESLDTGRRDLAGLGRRMVWGPAVLVNDVPGKNDDPVKLDAFGRSGEQLTKIASQARREILVQTPYLIMMPGTFALMEDLITRGVQVRIQTNSLASTDNLLAFAGYAGQRRKMLKMGIRIYEQQPDPVSRQHLVARSRFLGEDAILGLHAKTAVFDRQTVFIGTFNLDPRSTHLNTEMGLLIESAEFAEQVAASIERDMQMENSWHLVLDDKGDLEWISAENGSEVRYSDDPDAGTWNEIKIFFYSILPIEKLL
jgi:putative cardiolipin synthase